MSRDRDVVVVGLGALGSAACYWLSRRPGLRVLALERFEIGHPYGASEDVSRMAVEPFLTRTCLYTLTPDRDFVVDALPGHPNVHVVLGSAHAYKFASVLGRILAELVVDGSTPSAGELGAFRIDRPALRDPGAPRTFVV